MEYSYQRLIDSLPIEISDVKFPYACISEQHIQAVWFEQKYFKNLCTSEGISITVLSPGIWNSDAGPDFLKAHLIIGGIEVKGDIEIHLSDEGWTQHKHHLDERYNQVILHLSFWESDSCKNLLTKLGTSLVQAYLEPFLTVPQTRLLKLIDLDLYPYKKFLGSGACAHTLFRELPEKKAQDFFKSAAQWRLLQKKGYLQARIEDSELKMAAGIATALGYKNNAESFFELYIQMLKFKHLSEEEILALGMGICGFFSSKFQLKWGASPYYRILQDKFETHSQLIFAPVSLKLTQIRPLNHPVRRLAYLSKMLKDPTLCFIEKQMLQIWKNNWNSEKWKQLRTQLLELIPDYKDVYWNSHFTFECFERSETIPLIGQDLKIEILLNTSLPLLYEDIGKEGVNEELTAFEAFYEKIPASKSSKTKYLTHRFFGDTCKGKILARGITEQGAFQLHKDFCQHYEASCEGCPFVDRYRKHYN